MYRKIIDNEYIISISSGVVNGNITEQEYNKIMNVIQNKPQAPQGYDYKLKTNFEWELYELPIVEDVQ